MRNYQNMGGYLFLILDVVLLPHSFVRVKRGIGMVKFIVNKVKHMLDALTVRLLSEESYEEDFDRNYSKYLKYYRKRMY